MIGYTLIYYMGILFSCMKVIFVILGILCFMKYLKDKGNK